MNEEEIKRTLMDDPGHSVFADYAEYLSSDSRNEEGILICLKGLTYNPGCHKGRLILARLFYKLGFIPFALEQLSTLRVALPGNATIIKLIEKLDPTFESSAEKHVTSAGTPGDDIVAEAEFDFSEIEMIAEEKNK